jgi:hypothetical protein
LVASDGVRFMRCFRVVAVSLLLIYGTIATAKDKKKFVLPTDVLEARTVLVVVDPSAGIAVEAPNADRQALEDVENALTRWGRFRLVRSEYNADLVISVRKGNGKIAQPTIGGVPIDNRPVIVEPTNDASLERIPTPGQQPATRPDPHPQMEAGAPDDIFAVYRGKRENATNYPVVWRYSGKDGLRSPGVPALDAFRDLIIESEKQRAANP